MLQALWKPEKDWLKSVLSSLWSCLGTKLNVWLAVAHHSTANLAWSVSKREDSNHNRTTSKTMHAEHFISFLHLLVLRSYNLSSAVSMLLQSGLSRASRFSFIVWSLTFRCVCCFGFFQALVFPLLLKRAFFCAPKHSACELQTIPDIPA